MTLARVVAGGHAVLVAAAVVAPAVVLRAAGDRGGLPPERTGDVLAVSCAVGLVAAVLAARRLHAGTGTLAERWGAEAVGLAVLAPLAATLPVLTFLAVAARLPAEVATGRGMVPAAWAASLVLALLVAAGARRAVRRWVLRSTAPAGRVVRGRAVRTPTRDVVPGRVRRPAEVVVGSLRGRGTSPAGG
ncbi:hypothetical protein [Blastococcus sp. SYSU D00813]